MTRRFSEEYVNLINYNVPRTSVPNLDAGSSDIPTAQPTLETDELPKPPADGFIATYCCGDSG